MYQGNGNIIEVGTVFGGKSPATITQDTTTGVNNLNSATATVLGYAYNLKGLDLEDDDSIEDYERDLQALA